MGKNKRNFGFRKGGDDEGYIGPSTSLPQEVSDIDHEIKTQLVRPIKRNTVGIIPQTERNPEILYTGDGSLAAAIVLLTFYLLKPNVVDIINSTGKPVICGETLSPELWQIFSNALEDNAINIPNNPPKGTKGSRKKYTGYANSKGPIAVSCVKTVNTKAFEEIKPSIHALFSEIQKYDIFNDELETSDTDTQHRFLKTDPLQLSINKILSVQDDPEQQIELMRRIQGIRFLRKIPGLLCHEIGHLEAMEDALIQAAMDGEDSALKRWMSEQSIYKTGWELVQQKVTSERRWVMACSRILPNDIMYYLRDTYESTAELISDALIEEMSARTNITFKTDDYSKHMPQSSVMIMGLYRKLVQHNPALTSLNSLEM